MSSNTNLVDVHTLKRNRLFKNYVIGIIALELYGRGKLPPPPPPPFPKMTQGKNISKPPPVVCS